jgi:gag-polyprotein putative aspartyl protease
MSIKVYVNTLNKRAETTALLDSGATENFITTQYAHWLRLPIKQLPCTRKVCNVDGTPNKEGDITHFTDLEVQTGQKRVCMRFFLTNLEDQKLILGYLWFAAMQPKVDWARAWIDYDQLPVVLHTPDSYKAIFTRRVGKPAMPKANQDQWFIGRVMVEPYQIASVEKRQTLASKLAQEAKSTETTPLPATYQQHAHVFGEQEAQRFPGPRIWDQQSSSSQTPLPRYQGKFMRSPRMNKRPYRNSSKNTCKKGTSDH